MEHAQKYTLCPKASCEKFGILCLSNTTGWQVALNIASEKWRNFFIADFFNSDLLNSILISRCSLLLFV